MKQVFLRNGIARLEDVPAPGPDKNELLVKVCYSCISPGTERKQMVDSDNGSVMKSVVQKPERIIKAYNMIRSEGIKTTLAKAKGSLDLGRFSGYSLSGIVVEMGETVKDFTVGDRVACAGAENAFHAEFVSVPSLLAVDVPDGVNMQQASTVALGAISLHGIRRSSAQIGEYVGVIGLGALGQMTGLLLKNAGCQVIGFDLNPSRLDFAKSLGFRAVLDSADGFASLKVTQLTRGHGVDAVIITAASSGSAPIELASRICRKKGKVVVVGDTLLNLKRQDWYPKELDLLISTSYGPGRYDPTYEIKAQDYPYGYVRWTENRNMGAYLECLASRMSVAPLIRNIFPISEVGKAFSSIEDTSSPAPLILLQYEDTPKRETRIEVTHSYSVIKDRINVAIIGPGEFAKEVHLPNLKRLGNVYCLHAVMGKNGHKAKQVAKRYGAQYAATDYSEIMKDPEIDLVFITTRHDLHAPLAIQAAQAGKAVFMEKPMATTREQLINLEQVLKKTDVPFMVGFNRRFSPLMTSLKKHLAQRVGPLLLHYRVNTAAPPPEHWMHSPEGGGQLIGEGCHFVDLLNFVVGKELDSFSASAIAARKDRLPIESNFQVTFRYRDGSLANLLYTTLGNSEFPKEYMEAFFDGQVVVMDNFRYLKGYGSSLSPMHFKHEEKGHLEELQELAQCLKGTRNPPIQVNEMVSNTLLTLEIHDKLMRSGEYANDATK